MTIDNLSVSGQVEMAATARLRDEGHIGLSLLSLASVILSLRRQGSQSKAC